MFWLFKILDVYSISQTLRLNQGILLGTYVNRSSNSSRLYLHWNCAENSFLLWLQASFYSIWNNSIKILGRTDEWVAHPAEEKKISIPQPEAGTSRSWHRLLLTNRVNNWMDKAVMQQVPAIREKQEVVSLLPAKSMPLQRIGVQSYLAKKGKQEEFFNLFIIPLV